MGKLIIRPGEQRDVDAVQAIANNAKNLPYLGGFTMRGYIEDLYTKNEKYYPLNVVAELDGEIVGFSDSGDKGAFIQYDLVAVKEELRRQHIGTAMYAFHAYRAAFMGRRFLRDQTIHFNTVMQDGYLPYHGFEHLAGLRSRVRNFSTLNWWMLPVTPMSLKHFYDSISISQHDVTIIGLRENISKFDKYFEESLAASTDDVLTKRLNDNRELLSLILP